MAELIIKTKNIVSNIHKLNEYLLKHDIKWSLITKVLTGNVKFLEKILTDDVVKNLHSIGDSRLSSIRNIKRISPKLRTIYIKPPPKRYIPTIVKYADVSLNSSYETIIELNQEAKKQGKVHQVIIMIELGELREGVMRDKIVDFYKKVFNLSNIETIGVGSNLGCMYGIEPTYDKLLQLCLYKQLLEEMFDKKLELISGGSSITLPLIGKHKVPKAVNHFRIGEAAFFGTSPLYNKKFKNLSVDTFNFDSYIIELEEKAGIPDGKMSDANIGHTSELEKNDPALYEKSCRAILDFGMLDVDTKDLTPKDKSIEFIGTTSDMTVYNLKENKTAKGKDKYKVGHVISFIPNYMAVARLMNSRFMDIKIE